MTVSAASPASPVQAGFGRQATQRQSAAEAQTGLDEKSRQQVTELERTDREVRAHEGAHLAAAGGLARGVGFQYVTGPDGRQYAVAGEVNLDASPVAGNPEKTIQKAQQIRAAANAPARPSGQDQQVAAQAAQMEQAARQELAERQRKQQAEALESFRSPGESDRGGGVDVFA